jgi:hypothetical protein
MPGTVDEMPLKYRWAVCMGFAAVPLIQSPCAASMLTHMYRRLSGFFGWFNLLSIEAKHHHVAASAQQLAPCVAHVHIIDAILLSTRGGYHVLNIGTKCTDSSNAVTWPSSMHMLQIVFPATCTPHCRMSRTFV